MKLSTGEKTDLARITWEKFIVADVVIDALAPDEMTPDMYAKQTGLSYFRAAAKLRQYWLEGKVTRRKYRNHSFAYRVKA